MVIITKIEKYSIDKIIRENKLRAEKEIFPTGPVTVPVMFSEDGYNNSGYFRVENGFLAFGTHHQRIDFRFKLYGKSDGPSAILSMIGGFNNFIKDFSKIRPDMDPSIFRCADKILFDLGYVGKMVKADGVQTDSKGHVSIYSVNYAETLITKEDHEYFEYQHHDHNGNVTM